MQNAGKGRKKSFLLNALAFFGVEKGTIDMVWSGLEVEWMMNECMIDDGWMDD